MSSISSTVWNNRSRTIKSIGAIGAFIVAVAAAATSLVILQSRRRKQNDDRSSADDSSTDDDGGEFYQRLGISKENLPTHIQREIDKARKRKAKMEMISMKKPMYDNVYMLDTNGEQVCTISMKKAKWYIKKGIAEWSSFKEDVGVRSTTAPGNSEEEEDEEVKCIRLLFEHKGSKSKEASPEAVFLRSAKQNICVACGSGGRHIRHYIVPYSYRTLLPAEYKLHMSHDVVILCTDCHVECDRQTKIRMRTMETELRMKIGGFGSSDSPFIEDPHLSQIKSWAIALARWKEKMPPEKIKRYETTIREYLVNICNDGPEKDALRSGKDELTKEQLQKACSVDYRVKNLNYLSGSEIVVRSLKDSDSIEAFIIDWRKHFIDTVIPRHMPKGWRVDNPVTNFSWLD